MKTPQLGVVLVLVLLVATPAFAQTLTVHAGNHFGWEQAAPTLAVAQSYVYTPREGTVMQAALAGVVCTGTVSPFPCTAPIGTRTAGLHTFVVITIDPTTLSPLESPASNPVVFTFRGPIPAATNFGTRP